MNEKQKKNLKTIGAIAGCIAGGLGLMYAGYLCAEFLPMKNVRLYSCTPAREGAITLGIKIPFTPSNWISQFSMDKETAIKLVKVINQGLQEV